MCKMRLIIRADDIGYSEAVNYGIEKSVKEGLIRSAGLMPNMDAAAHGIKLLEGTGVCIGQHTNICLGKPCADPKRIPSLLDENGKLKSSRSYREAWKKGEEFTVLEEMILEVEAQYFRFKELVGKEPGYFEGHAVMSKNLGTALEIVAQKYGLRYIKTNIDTFECCFDGKAIACAPLNCMAPDYDPWHDLKEAVLHGCRDIPNMFVCHPGYIDYDLLQSSSLTLNRAKEVAMLTDQEMHRWLDGQDVELITYDDI